MHEALSHQAASKPDSGTRSILVGVLIQVPGTDTRSADSLVLLLEDVLQVGQNRLLERDATFTVPETY